LAIQPVQQFSYTTVKNSTDAALIIDAMDLLHSGALVRKQKYVEVREIQSEAGSSVVQLNVRPKGKSKPT